MRMQDRLRASLAVLVLAILALLALPLATVATHQPTVEDVVAEATSPTWNMTCEPTGGTVDCVAQDFDLTWFEHASIRPGTGNLTALGTEATVYTLPLDSFFISWHSALHSVACARDRGTAAP